MDAERRVDKLQSEIHSLTTSLVARNDREFQLLYGNPPAETVAVEAVQYTEEDDYTETVMDLREDAALLGLIDEPVGP